MESVRLYSFFFVDTSLSLSLSLSLFLYLPFPSQILYLDSIEVDEVG